LVVIDAKVKARLAVVAAAGAVAGAIATIANLLEYLNTGKANLVWGGTLITLVAVGVVAILAVTFPGALPLSQWTWFHKTIVASLGVIAVSGVGLGILAAQPPTPPPPPPPKTTPPDPSLTNSASPLSSATTPTTTPGAATTPPPPPPQQVIWKTPKGDGTQIAPKKSVPLAGYASGIPDGDSVWIIATPYNFDGDYFVVHGRSVGVGSGDFSTVDVQVGAANDAGGGNGYTYTVVDATDETCALQLAMAGRNDDHKLSQPLEKSCKRLAPSVRVDII
jgi:hypothetical protein